MEAWESRFKEEGTNWSEGHAHASLTAFSAGKPPMLWLMPTSACVLSSWAAEVRDPDCASILYELT